VSCDASFVKTGHGCQHGSVEEELSNKSSIGSNAFNTWAWICALTQAGREKLRIQVGDELLCLGVEHAHAGYDIAWQTDADNLHDGLKDQQAKVGEVWVRAVRRKLVLLEGIEEAIARAIGVGIHQGEVSGGKGVEDTQPKRLRRCEERHLE